MGCAESLPGEIPYNLTKMVEQQKGGFEFLSRT